MTTCASTFDPDVWPPNGTTSCCLHASVEAWIPWFREHRALELEL